MPVSSLVAPLARPRARLDRKVENEVLDAHGSARERSSERDALWGHADEDRSDFSEDALDRAADSIRPSWHGAEPVLPARLPAPAPLPVFEPYALPRTPFYTADSTQRTVALLPERVAALFRSRARGRASTLARQQVAQMRHFVRIRPWATALGALGGALMLALLITLFSGSEATPPATGLPTAKANVPARAEAPSPNAPPMPALPPSPSAIPNGPAAAGSALTPDTAEAAPPSPAATRSAKKRDKRVARTAKAALVKPSTAKKSAPVAR